MKVNRLSLINFRNYDQETFEFYEGLNLFIGRNGQGKTNIIEALAFVSSLRSFRMAQERFLIMHNKSYARMEMELENEKEIKKNLIVVLQKQGKSLLVNKIPILSSKDFITHLQVVLFTPDDMNFFDDSPKLRRREIDMLCGKLSPRYIKQLVLTNKLLRQRNALLKQEQMDDTLLEILTNQLTEAQVPIIQLRLRLIQYLNQNVEKMYYQLSGEQTKIHFIYKSDVNDFDNNDYKNQLLNKMRECLVRDKLYKATTIGIQRDDLETYFDNQLISNIASQGQKRLVILAIKLTLAKFIETSSKQKPILLLDDVFSELDGNHQQRLLRMIPKDIQIFITTTHYQPFKSIKEKLMAFEIENGKCVKRRLIHG